MGGRVSGRANGWVSEWEGAIAVKIKLGEGLVYSPRHYSNHCYALFAQP